MGIAVGVAALAGLLPVGEAESKGGRRIIAGSVGSSFDGHPILDRLRQASQAILKRELGLANAAALGEVCLEPDVNDGVSSNEGQRLVFVGPIEVGPNRPTWVFRDTLSPFAISFSCFKRDRKRWSVKSATLRIPTFRAQQEIMVWISRQRRRKALGDGAGGSVHSLDLERGHQRIVNLADELDVQEPVLDDGLLFFVRGGGKPFGKKLVVAERFLSLEAHVETALAVFSLPDLRE